ncbi:MAG: metallophosphoesterase family protein [Elusimicrobiota bacterium]
MRYAIFSDIHSSIEALEAVLLEISKQNVDEYICCGDIVGYGPNPNECVEKIKTIKKGGERVDLKIVAGNHDRASIGLFDIEWFNDNAKAAVRWTVSVLTDENKKFLLELPEKIVIADFTIVHGSPREPINEYLLKSTDMAENLNFFSTQFCFIGHSHRPFIYSAETGITIPGENETIEIASKSIINVGSVGQPRDGDNRAGFLIFENNSVTFYRVEYDIKAVQEKMRTATLPEYLIERLKYGR